MPESALQLRRGSCGAPAVCLAELRRRTHALGHRPFPRFSVRLYRGNPRLAAGRSPHCGLMVEGGRTRRISPKDRTKEFVRSAFTLGRDQPAHRSSHLASDVRRVARGDRGLRVRHRDDALASRLERHGVLHRRGAPASASLTWPFRSRRVGSTIAIARPASPSCIKCPHAISPRTV